MNQEIQHSDLMARNKRISSEEMYNFIEMIEYTPNAIYFIARDRNHVVGNIYAIPRGEDLLTHMANIGYQVHPHYHRQSVGSQLMARLISECRNTDLEILVAEVLEKNTASIHLLRKFHFDQVGCVVKGVKIEENQYENLLLFQRIL